MSLYRDIRYRDSLKRRGHDIIDELAAMGVPRYRAYRRLARAMRVPEAQAHFGREWDIRKLERMVSLLAGFRDNVASHRPKVFKTKKKAKKPAPPKPAAPQPLSRKERMRISKKRDTLPREEMVRALAELKRSKESPFRRVLSFIGVL
jgi:hypothetical protein